MLKNSMSAAIDILNGTKGTQRSEHGDSALGERIERLERGNALLKAAVK